MHNRPISLITKNDPKAPTSEAYRILRTNVQFSSVDKEIKVIVVTSANPKEGKSTTVSNMAVTFSQAGEKVLIIDADMRKPALHTVFGVSNKEGLSSLASKDTVGTEHIIKNVSENLDIMTSGIIPPNPSEILSSSAVRSFINSLKDEYDHIFIDSPPVCSVADAAILSSMADGTILVALAGKVNIDSMKRAKEALRNVNANIIGVVLNGLAKKSKSNYYYYYYYGENKGTKKKNK